MKRLVKQLALLIATLVVLPRWLLYQVSRPVVGTRRAFQSFSQSVSRVPGPVGDLIRAAAYRLTLAACGPDCQISFGAIFSHPDARLGQGVYIGAYCQLGWVDLGDHVLLAGGVHVPSGSAQHAFDDAHRLVKEQGGDYTQVRVGADSWIGTGAVVLVDVGAKCVVGAGAVVTKALPEYAIAVGNPARISGDRRTRKAPIPSELESMNVETP
jgi:virginiamycin A acetyltransferase